MRRLVLAIDPGSEESAFVVWDAEQQLVLDHAIGPNLHVLDHLTGLDASRAVLVVEQIESFGMAVGAEVFRTVWWSGRFHQAWNGEAYQLPRRVVKSHLCYSTRATDANVRQAILDRFGATKAIAVGTKHQPGPLYGLKGHEYAALAVALTWADQHAERQLQELRHATSHAR